MPILSQQSIAQNEGEEVDLYTLAGVMITLDGVYFPVVRTLCPLKPWSPLEPVGVKDEIP